MYFLTALVFSIISFLIYILNTERKKLHLEVLSIVYSAAALMWLIDCIAGSINGDPFLSFEFPIDLWISLWTILAGIIFWAAYLIYNKIKNNRH